MTARVNVPHRVAAVDWQRVAEELDAQGNAVIERLLVRTECDALAAFFPRGDIVRCRARAVSTESTCDMGSAACALGTGTRSASSSTTWRDDGAVDAVLVR